jgi:hypothetical protein
MIRPSYQHGILHQSTLFPRPLKVKDMKPLDSASWRNARLDQGKGDGDHVKERARRKPATDGLGRRREGRPSGMEEGAPSNESAGGQRSIDAAIGMTVLLALPRTTKTCERWNEGWDGAFGVWWRWVDWV